MACRAVVAVMVSTLAVHRVTADAPPADADSLARFTPAHVGFFLEFPRLGETLGTRRLDAAWDALTGLAGSETRVSTTTPVGWKTQVERMLGLPMNSVVEALLSERVALIAPSLGELGAGVLMAQVSDGRTIDRLIAQLRRRRRLIEDRPLVAVRRYRTGQRVWLARMSNIVVLSTGPAGTTLLHEVVAHLAGLDRASLAHAPEFLTERRHLPAGYQGLVYVAALEKPDDGSATGLNVPGLASLRRGVAGLYGRPGGVDIEIRGLLASPTPRRQTERVSTDALARLPANTMLAYATTVDFPRAARGIDTGRYPMLQVYLKLAQALSGQREIDKRVLDALGPQTVVVVGHARTQSTDAPSYVKPMVSVLVQVNDAAIVAEAARKAIENLVAVLNVLSIRKERPVQLRVEPFTHGTSTLYRVDLRDYIKPLTRCTYFHTLEFCWTVSGKWLILSSHSEHTRQLIDVLRADPRGFPPSPLRAPVARIFTGSAAARASALVVVQPALSGRVVQTWLDYIERAHPRMREPTWWQDILAGRGGERVTLGVGLAVVPDHPGKLDISTVLPGWPAAGRLHAGDRIIAVDGRVLDAKDTRRDFNRAVRLRQDRQKVVLRIERDDRTRDVVIRLPRDNSAPDGFNPVRTLHHLTKLASQFSVGGYTAWHDTPERISARLSLTLAPSDAQVAR